MNTSVLYFVGFDTVHHSNGFSRGGRGGRGGYRRGDGYNRRGGLLERGGIGVAEVGLVGLPVVEEEVDMDNNRYVHVDVRFGFSCSLTCLVTC